MNSPRGAPDQSHRALNCYFTDLTTEQPRVSAAAPWYGSRRVFGRNGMVKPSKSIKEPMISIADVQNLEDTRRINIDKVGIKSIRHPVRVKDRSGGEQHTIANFNMYVYLPHNFKGTHMSRFVEILNARETEITVESFKGMLPEMIEKLNSEAGNIEMTFPYFVNKSAPVSGVKSLMDYDVTFTGEIRDGKACMTLKVVVPVTSLCP